MDILLKGGTVVSPEKSKKVDVRIQADMIIEVGENLIPHHEKVIDVTGKLLFPGFIDTHTHFDLDAGDFFTADNFYTGTKAAIAGGTTTILDHITPDKGKSLKEALKRWHEKSDNQSSCDYGYHMAIIDWNEKIKNELKDMTKAGVTSYKLYMAYKFRVNDKEIYQILKEVKEEGGLVVVHCENGDLVEELIQEQQELGNLSPKAHPKARPDVTESEAINRLITIAKLAEAPVNIVHLSTKKGFDLVVEARKEGQKVYIESCPQYFLLDESKYDLPEFESAKYVLSPPLRKQEDINCLWKGIKEDQIDTIGTDHCSFNVTGQKERGRNDFSKIPNGIPGVEHRPVLMYTYGVAENKMTKEQLCATLSTNAAKLYGMYPQKGIIEKGSHADIVVWDPEYKGIITVKDQLQNVDNTPFEGMDIRGRAEYVLLRGEIVAKDGKVIQENKGNYIVRQKPCLI